MRVLLTGNGSGIGAAINASMYDKHQVFGTHNAAGTRMYDVADSAGRIMLINAAYNEMNGIDVLINNAGVLDTEEFGHLTEDGIATILHTNLVVPMLLAQRCVELGAKLIVNVGSFYGISGSYGKKPTYAASKAALHNVTISLARLLGPSGVRVVGIAPGIVPSRMHDMQGGIEKHRSGHSCVGRLGTADEVASAVRFVMENEYINGTIIEVHGGR